jgi:general stress protein CsbA
LHSVCEACLLCVCIPKVLISSFRCICLSLLILSSHSCLELFSSFHCVFIDVFNGFVHFLFKNLYHTNKASFEVLVLCFSHIALLRAYCDEVACKHIVMPVIDCVFTLASRHLWVA